MSGSTKYIDARGLPCPRPVVLLRDAISAGEADILEILVDTEAARENVRRFAVHSGCSILLSESVAEAVAEGMSHGETPEKVIGRRSHYRVRIGIRTERETKTHAESEQDSSGGASTDRGTVPDTGRWGGEGPGSATEPHGTVLPVVGSTVLLSSDEMGRGSEELGRLLMRGFLYALSENDIIPKRIIAMNSGIRLAIAGSESLVNLQKLAGRGVEILVCGTCLEYLGLASRLAVGRVSNMYEIAGFLAEGRTLSL